LIESSGPASTAGLFYEREVYEVWIDRVEVVIETAQAGDFGKIALSALP